MTSAGSVSSADIELHLAGAPIADRYDVVVVGSGIGGMTAAGLVAQAGLSVLLVEAAPGLGGLVHHFERGPYVFDPSCHLVVDPDSFRRLLAHLEVEELVHFLDVPDFFTAIGPDGYVRAPFGKDEFFDAYAAALPSATDEAVGFLDTCAAVHREAHSLPSRLKLTALESTMAEFPTLMKYRRATLADVIDEHISDERAKALCAAPGLYLGLSPSELSFVTFAQMLMSHVTHGGAYVQGGVQRLIDAIAASIQRNGGEIVVGNAVTKIVLEDDVVAGVELEHTGAVRARAVVSNADPYRTFGELLPADCMSPRYTRKLTRMAPSISAFSLFGATTLDVAAVDHASSLMFMFDGWDLDTAYRATVNGEPAAICVAAPTLIDPTKAPPGHHEVIAVASASYDGDWDVLRGQYEVGATRLIESRLPGFQAGLQFSESSTPITIERYTGNHRGAIYGWGHGPEQPGRRPPAQVTPLEGLYLAGSWTAPSSAFVRAVNSGRICAEEIVSQTRPGVEIPVFQS